MSHVPSLNLNNFEEECFTGCQYVLTSPRSLEACSRVRVQPKDLLYKGLADFQAELLPLDLHISDIYQQYSNHERTRRRNLKLCRDLRRLIISQESDGNYRPSADRSYIYDYGDKNACFDDAYSKVLAYSNALNFSDSVNADRTDKLGLEMQRTKGVVLSADNVATYPAIERRLNEIKTERMELNSKINKPPPKRNDRTRGRSASPSRSRCHVNRSRSCTSLDIYEPHSLSTVSTGNRFMYGSSRSLNSGIPTRDKKILDLMALKEKLSQDDELRKHAAHEKWERERDLEIAIRLENEAHHRRILREENLIDKYKLMQLKKKQVEEYERKRSELVDALNLAENQWARSLAKQRMSHQREIMNRVQQNREKKFSQERRLELLSREMDNTRNEMWNRKEKNVKSARSRKSLKISSETMKRKCENEIKIERHQQQKDAVDHAQKVEDTLMEIHLDGKHGRAEKNLEKVTKQQVNQLYLSALEREKKFHKARISQEKQDNEIQDWQNRLSDHRKQADERASKSVAKKLEAKSQATHESRIVRKQEQKKNVEVIEKELQQWEKDTREFISRKDRRSKILKNDKENWKHQNRVLARTSESLRDRFKAKHGRDSLEKKALQALMVHNMERKRGVMTSQKNKSSLKIAYM